jgi:hypothetical protein
VKRIYALAAVSAAGLFVVAAMGISSPIAKAQSAKPFDVTVVNTTARPVPVAVQGTPTVNVGNLPSATLQPFIHQFSITLLDDDTGDSSDPIVVPAGKILVIDTVSGTAREEISANLNHHFSLISVDDQGSSFSTPFVPDGTFNDDGQRYAFFTKQVTLYARPGTAVRAFVSKDGTTGSGSTSKPATVRISGHLVDAPSAG